MNCFTLVMALLVVLGLSTLSFKPGHRVELSTGQTQSLKALAALYIAIGHISYVVTPPAWFRAIMSHTWIDVGVFFFISGYGLTYGFFRKPDYLKRFSRRFLAVGLPFVLAHAVYLIADLLFQIPFTGMDILYSFLGQATLVRNGWFVPASLLFYALFWLTWRLKAKNGTKLLLMFLLLAAYLFITWQFPYYWWRNTFSFFAGICWMCLCEGKKEQLKKSSRYWGCFAVCVLGYAAGCMLFPVVSQNCISFNAVPYNIMSMFGVSAVILLYTRIGKGNRVTSFIASISYEIYLYHGLFIDIFRSKVLYVSNDIAYALLIYAATFGTAFVMHRLAARLLSGRAKAAGAPAR